MESDYCRASRLAWILKRYAEDDNVVMQLASALSYIPEDLKKDMQAIVNCLHNPTESNEND